MLLLLVFLAKRQIELRMANFLVPLVSIVLLAHFVQVDSLSGTCNSYEREKLNEGYKPRVYLDTEGHPTVGIGFNLDRSDARRRLSAVGANYDQIRAGSATLTDYQIRTLFNDDMANAVNCAYSWLSQVWGRMNNNQRSAVADMAFNLGCYGLQQFKNMKAALLRGDYGGAAAEMRNSKWCRQVKSRCDRNIACMKGGLAMLMEILGLNR